MRIRIGTSGFSFAAWRGRFYPSGLSASKMLAFYGSALGAVEINGTFYKVPTAETFAAWSREVPEDFRFALKVNRFVTHAKKLAQCTEALAAFHAAAAPLGPRLGPWLVQVPAFVKRDDALLADFLSAVPAGVRVALELLDPSWRADGVLSMMRENDAAWVWTETDEAPALLEDTASFAYVRLRKAAYDEGAMNEWAQRLTERSGDATVFFKHEDEAAGPAYAKALTARIANVDVKRRARPRSSK